VKSEGGPQQDPSQAPFRQHEGRGELEGDDQVLGADEQGWVGDEGVGYNGASTQYRSNQSRTIEPFDAPEPQLRVGRHEIRQHHGNLYAPQSPTRCFVEAFILGGIRGHRRKNGKGHQKREPVVIDLAVREVDDHPFEIEHEDGDAGQPRHLANQRKGRKNKQSRLDDR